LRPRSSPQGALPLGTPLLSLKERSKEAIWPKTAFSAGVSQNLPAKNAVFCDSKSFWGAGGFFQKSPSPGWQGQSPCVLRPRSLPQGALPLGTPLLSLKERSKEAIYRKLRFRQGFLKISLQKTQFFAIPKVFGVQGDFFKNPPRRGSRGRAPAS